MRPAVSPYEQKVVDEVFQIFTQCNAMRPMHASQWEETARLIAPNYINTFFRESYNFPGLKKTQTQVDASGMVALTKFSAIVDSMATPFSSKWHNLEATNPDVQKNRQVRLWFEQVNKILFHYRYLGAANFRKQNQSIYQQVGAFGNGPMFIDQLYDMHGRAIKGFRYKALPIGEVFIRTNHQGQVDAFVRAFRMTARQAMQQWGHDMLPDALDAAQDKDSEQPFDFFHCVYPNTDYDPDQKLKKTNKPFYSCYVSVTERRLMQEGGYNSFPLSFARYAVAPGEIYGRGPAQDILPALKTLNAEKAMFLKVGHRIADPVMLLGGQADKDFSLVPGAQMSGYVTDDGKPLAMALEMGNLPVSKEMMDEERSLIGDLFLTKLFENLYDPRMTATQVIELINQKGVFLAPTVGGMASDYLDGSLEREISLGVDQGMFPPMPPMLKEAKGEYKIVYTSPLFKSARAGEASGFLRTLESALQVAGQTGDPSVLDAFNFDIAFRDIANIQDVPESWMEPEDRINAKRQQRAQSAQQQQQIQALPAQAAMLKAQAMVSKRTGGSMPSGIGEQQAA